MELAGRIALLLRKDLTVKPSREPSLNVWLASFKFRARWSETLNDLNDHAAVVLE
jgi:hypothetical protein